MWNFHEEAGRGPPATGRTVAMIADIGPIRQVAFLTRDLDASIRFYCDIGVGPWFRGDRALFDRLEYRGAAAAPDLRYAVAPWHGLQLELIEPVGAGPSVVHEWAGRPFTGQLQHHVAVWPEHVDACIAAAQGAGFEVVQDGATGAGRFLYLLHPANPDFFLEITHATPERQAFSRHVFACGRGWDGSRPVRPYGVIE